MADTDRRGRFISYPTGRLVAILDDAEEARRATADLTALGLRAEDLEWTSGDEAARRLDATGAAYGWLGRLRRAGQLAQADQSLDWRRYQRAAEGGAAIVVVRVPRGVSRDAIVDTLVGHGGRFINYYGRLATEAVTPFRGGRFTGA